MVKIIYQMKKRFISNLQNTFSLKANFRCETAVRHIKMEQFFGKLENHQKNRDNIQTTSTIFNMIKVVNLEAPQTHDVISMSIRRRIDVETTSCVYRETLGVNIYSFNSKLYKFLSFSFFVTNAKLLRQSQHLLTWFGEGTFLALPSRNKTQKNHPEKVS